MIVLSRGRRASARDRSTNVADPLPQNANIVRLLGEEGFIEVRRRILQNVGQYPPIESFPVLEKSIPELMDSHRGPGLRRTRTTINGWIVAILLFDFDIRHVPAEKHTGADGLSQRPRAPEDKDPVEEFEEWVEDAMSIMYMEEQRPVVRYGAPAGGQREDDGEGRVRMLGTEVLPVDEEGCYQGWKIGRAHV